MNIKDIMGDFPISFDINSLDSWPKPTKPIAEIKIKLTGKHLCGISGIEVIAERDHLLIYADRPHQDCGPLYFRFNLESHAWTQVDLQEVKALKTDAENEIVPPMK